MTEKKIAHHWLVVGYVSPAAEAWIKEAGGDVLYISSLPAMIAVALPYDPAGAWVWRKGEREYRRGVEFWNTGEIQEASTGLTLQYRRKSDPSDSAIYCSVDDTYIILPDEEFDPAAGKVAEPGSWRVPEPEPPADLDDFPF